MYDMYDKYLAVKHFLVTYDYQSMYPFLAYMLVMNALILYTHLRNR